MGLRGRDRTSGTRIAALKNAGLFRVPAVLSLPQPANGYGAAVLILVVAGFNNSHSMLIYLGVWLVALACQRICTFRPMSRGVVWHSHYQGWPHLAVKLACGNVKAAVFLVEPLLAAGLGYIFRGMGEPLVGTFLMTGAFSLFVRELIYAQITSRRLMAMHDGRIEQEHLTREYRRQQGGGR